MGGQETSGRLLADFPEMKRKPDYFDERVSAASRADLAGSVDRPVRSDGRTVPAVHRGDRLSDRGGARRPRAAGATNRNAANASAAGRSSPGANPGFPQTDDHPVVNVTLERRRRLLQLAEQEGRQTLPAAQRGGMGICLPGRDECIASITATIPRSCSRYAHLVNVPGSDKFANIQDQVHFSNRANHSRPRSARSCPTPGAFTTRSATCGNGRTTGKTTTTKVVARRRSSRPRRGLPRGRRGGAWNSFPMYTRPAFRNLDDPHTRCVNIGFRVVCDE